MKQFKFNLVLLAAFALSLVNCTFEDNPNYSSTNSSTDQLLVKKFTTAPIFDGEIDEVWSSARPMVSEATVSNAGSRVITFKWVEQWQHRIGTK